MAAAQHRGAQGRNARSRGSRVAIRARHIARVCSRRQHFFVLVSIRGGEAPAAATDDGRHRSPAGHHRDAEAQRQGVLGCSAARGAAGTRHELCSRNYAHVAASARRRCRRRCHPRACACTGSRDATTEAPADTCFLHAAASRKVRPASALATASATAATATASPRSDATTRPAVGRQRHCVAVVCAQRGRWAPIAGAAAAAAGGGGGAAAQRDAAPAGAGAAGAPRQAAEAAGRARGGRRSGTRGARSAPARTATPTISLDHAHETTAVAREHTKAERRAAATTRAAAVAAAKRQSHAAGPAAAFAEAVAEARACRCSCTFRAQRERRPPAQLAEQRARGVHLCHRVA